MEDAYISTMPLMGCLDLLLANVEKAEKNFLSSSDEELKNWLDSYKGDKLDAICLFCTNWLENEVLNGYCDIQVNEVNLDEWFENAEIQEFIEKEDKKQKNPISGAYMQKISSNLKRIIDDSNEEIKQNINLNDESNLPLPGGNKRDIEDSHEGNLSKSDFIKNKSLEVFKKFNEIYYELRFLIGDLLKNNKLTNKSTFYIYVYVFLILFLFGIALSFLKNNNKDDSINNNIVTLNSPDKGIKTADEILEKNASIDKNNIGFINSSVNENILNEYELKVQSPNLDQLKTLIQSWYFNKSRFLAGKGEPSLTKIVKQDLIDRLYQERDSDIKNNISKNISTNIKDMKFISQSSARIAVLINLLYTEEILSKDGKSKSKTTYPLNVKYIFGFSDDSWKLVDYISGS